MTRLPRTLAFDYFRNVHMSRLRLLVELALAVASFVLIAVITFGVI